MDTHATVLAVISILSFFVTCITFVMVSIRQRIVSNEKKHEDIARRVSNIESEQKAYEVTFKFLGDLLRETKNEVHKIDGKLDSRFDQINAKLDERLSNVRVNNRDP